VRPLTKSLLGGDFRFRPDSGAVRGDAACLAQGPLDELANADWAQRYLARWPAVEAMMDRLAPERWTHEAMEEVARAAECAASEPAAREQVS
jgi:hypothetical protein